MRALICHSDTRQTGRVTTALGPGENEPVYLRLDVLGLSQYGHADMQPRGMCSLSAIPGTKRRAPFLVLWCSPSPLTHPVITYTYTVLGGNIRDVPNVAESKEQVKLQ